MSVPLIWKDSRPNVTLRVRDRERGLAGTPAYRRNCHIWRTMVCDEKTSFKKAWSISSKKMIHSLGGCLYLDDFRTCYTLNGGNSMPTLVFKNPDPTHTYKIKAYLHCAAELSTLLPNGGHKPYIAAVTKCQNLIRIDLKTGIIIEKIYLGSIHNFKDLSWDVLTLRAVACSTQSKTPSGLKSFLLFNVFPFEVIGKLTVTKEVFGNDICDANITDGMLVTMHRHDKVRMYNLETILEKFMKFPMQLGKRVTLGHGLSEESGIVGSVPFGIPTNVEIKERPPILLEVTCFNRDVAFGGYPWHYLYIPMAKDPLLEPNANVGWETYLVCDVANKKVIANGPLDMDCGVDAETKAFFHMDESQRVLQLSDKEVIVSKFETQGSEKTELKKSFRLIPPKLQTLQFQQCEEEDSEDDKVDAFGWETSFSGRPVNTQWRKNLRKQNIIRDLNYDVELDVLLLTYIEKVGQGSMYSPPDGKLQIHCNQTGRLLKTQNLDGMGFEFRLCMMEMDLDLMIHIFAADPLGTMVCNLYQLDRSPDSLPRKPVVTMPGSQMFEPTNSDDSSSEYNSDSSF